MSYQLYRNTSLGQTLQDSLYELIHYGHIPQSLASDVLLQFDKTVNEALNTRAKNRVVFHSQKLSTYRFCDNVWTFILKDVQFKENQREVCEVDKLKIVACDAKAAHVQPSSSSIRQTGDDDTKNTEEKQ